MGQKTLGVVKLTNPQKKLIKYIHYVEQKNDEKYPFAFFRFTFGKNLLRKRAAEQLKEKGLVDWNFHKHYDWDEYYQLRLTEKGKLVAETQAKA